MKRLALTLAVLISACSHSRQSGARIEAASEPFALHLDASSISFCDDRGGWKAALPNGSPSPSNTPCPKPEEPNVSCSGTISDVEVRAPLSSPDDIVDAGARSFPLTGRVHDCAAEGAVLAVVTAHQVVAIRTDQGTSTTVSDSGGERVAVGSGWIAWTQGHLIRVERLGP
jgi:hypothetical protein